MILTLSSTTDIDFGDAYSSGDTGYFLHPDKYRPGIATRKTSTIGNNIFENVRETITFSIVGDDADEAFEFYHDLVAMLDQADRWRLAHGIGVDPILFELKAPGSTITNPLQAVVSGPYKITAMPMADYIEDQAHLHNITLTFLRTPRLLGDEESDTSTSLGNPNVLTCTFTPSLSIQSPVEIRMTNWVGDPTGNQYLLVADASDKIALISTSTHWNTMDDPSYYDTDLDLTAKNTYVLQTIYTAINTEYETSTLDISTLLNDDTFHIGFLINLKHTATYTDTCTFSFYIKIDIGNGTEYRTPWTYLDSEPTTVRPRILTAGSIVLPETIGNITTPNLSLVGKISDVTQTYAVNIDNIAMIDLGNDTSRIIEIKPATRDTEQSLDFLHRELTHTRPAVVTVTDGYPLSYGGLAKIDNIGTTVAALWYSNGKSSSSVFGWRSKSEDYSTYLSNAITATRRPAYLTPQ